MAKSIVDQFKLNGQVALITGGNRGLGFEVGKALAEAGANIVIASRDTKQNSIARDHISSEYNVDSMAFECDVTKGMFIQGGFYSLYLAFLQDSELVLFREFSFLH